MSTFKCIWNKSLSDKELIDESINMIINGKTDTMSGEIHKQYSKYIYDELSKHPDNANCLYHLGLLVSSYHKKLGIKKDQYLEYWKKAAALNHPEASFYLGFKYFNRGQSTNREEAMTLGMNAFLNGYGDIITSCSEYYDTIYRNETMLMAITKLKEQKRALEIQNHELTQRNETLTQELEQEKLKPPEQGGSEYEKAAKHFESFSK